MRGLESGGPVALLVLVACLVCGLAAVGSAIALIAGRRLPPPVPVYAASVPLVIAVVHGLWTQDVAGGIEMISPDRKSALVAAAIAETMSVRLVSVSVVLVCGILLLACALAGAMRGPRSLVGAGIALPVVALEGALGLSLFVLGIPVFALATSIAMGLLGVLVAVACLSGDPEKGGPEAAITAAFAWPLAAGAWWAAVHAWGQSQIFAALAYAAPEVKAEILQAGLSEIRFERWLGLAAVLLAPLPAVAGIVAGGEDRSRRALWIALCLPVLAVPILLVVLDPTASQLAQAIAIWTSP